MGSSDKDIIIISVCLFTLTVAMVMYFVLCVNHVYRRRCKLKEKEEKDVVYKFKSRRLSEHQKHVAWNRELQEEDIIDLSICYSEPYPEIKQATNGKEPNYKVILRGEPTAETRRYWSKDETLPGLINIADNQPVAIVWAPPPPPDPPNPN